MKRALVIIDLQKSFGPTPEMERAFKERAKEYDVVVATRFVNGNGLFQSVLQYPELKEEELEMVSLPEGVKIFKKAGYGLPPDLLQHLKLNEVSEADVGGLETDACVLAAMYSLWDANIKPTLLTDLSSTPDQKMAEAALLISRRNFGT